MSCNACSHKISGLRSPDPASSMIFAAMARWTPSSQSPTRKAMQTISKAMPRTRLSSESNRWPLMNGVIGMGASTAQSPRACGRRPVGDAKQSKACGNFVGGVPDRTATTISNGPAARPITWGWSPTPILLRLPLHRGTRRFSVERVPPHLRGCAMRPPGGWSKASDDDSGMDAGCYGGPGNGHAW
jgi:hypothetical protein